MNGQAREQKMKNLTNKPFFIFDLRLHLVNYKRFTAQSLKVFRHRNKYNRNKYILENISVINKMYFVFAFW